MANTLSRVDKKAARAAVIRTQQVNIKTTLMLFRCRNVIEQNKRAYQIVAEEMLLWGWSGTPQQKQFLDHMQAKNLLNQARATSDLSLQTRASFLENELLMCQRISGHNVKRHIAAIRSQREINTH
jgi:hypothetical protein